MTHSPDAGLRKITEKVEKLNLSPAFSDLARLEYVLFQMRHDTGAPTAELSEITVNPHLHLTRSTWSGLLNVIRRESSVEELKAADKDEFILIYRHPQERKLIIRKATKSDLLALKIVTDGEESETLVKDGQITPALSEQVLNDGVDNGILLQPQSKIRRSPAHIFSRGEDSDKKFINSDFFTLQWHVTQKCDLHCRHCYDRSERNPLQLSEGLRILDDLKNFCRAHFVKGQVTFSGGNPLLYPDFMALYRAAVERGLQVAILGNPAESKILDELNAIRPPVFFQISLEGLSTHNDYIRGSGHFQRSLKFLDLLREKDIFSMVMLTLTRANLDQVLPLTEVLRGHVDLFTFNRLAMVGEGTNLYSVEPEKYRDFLERYLAAAENSSFIALKDNFFNLIKQERKQPWFGGCAGYGCGAAFNFMALLADGEVHACRKLPSLLGNIFSTNFAEIYNSELAERYRQGSKACQECKIRPVCGGCPAVTYGFGLDIFEDRDPYCFLESP